MEMDIDRLVKEYGSYQKRFRLSDCVDEIIELYVYIINRRTRNIDGFFIWKERSIILTFIIPVINKRSFSF